MANFNKRRATTQIETQEQTERRIQTLVRDIEYHHKSLSYCDDKFPYRRDIKSSLAEKYASLGHVYYRKQDYKEASKYYLKAREYNPDHYQSINLLGDCLIKLGDYKNARLYLRETVDGVKYLYERHLKVAAKKSIELAYKEERKLRDAVSTKSYLSSTQTFLGSLQLNRPQPAKHRQNEEDTYEQMTPS